MILMTFEDNYEKILSLDSVWIFWTTCN